MPRPTRKRWPPEQAKKVAAQPAPAVAVQAKQVASPLATVVKSIAQESTDPGWPTFSSVSAAMDALQRSLLARLALLESGLTVVLGAGDDAGAGSITATSVGASADAGIASGDGAGSGGTKP